MVEGASQGVALGQVERKNLLPRWPGHSGRLKDLAQLVVIEGADRIGTVDEYENVVCAGSSPLRMAGGPRQQDERTRHGEYLPEPSPS